MRPLKAVLVEPAPPVSADGWAVRVGGWLRRFRSAAARGDTLLSLEGRVSLGPKKALMLVNCCGKRVLVAVSGDSVTPILELPRPKRGGKAGTR